MAFRPDIQALRALAVTLVFAFHLFPKAVSGGYVGVDVFFVVSGFLITSLLLKEQNAKGTIDLIAFYRRRIRRLLPAATLVLVVTALASFIFLPQIRWEDTASHLLASAFYVENFLLISQSTNYLAEDFAASPFQHYWSLSIEEQFYFFWPLVLLFGGWLGLRTSRQTTTVLTILCSMIVLSSLAASVWFSFQGATAGYFHSVARMWELGLGGGAALFLMRSQSAVKSSSLLCWVALATIAATAFFYNDKTLFPGYAALLPTLPAAYILIAGIPASSLLERAIKTAPIQWLGDHSYSIYLWHWPVLVLAEAKLERSLTIIESIGVIVAVLLMSAASKKFVEDRFRHPAHRNTSPNKSQDRAFVLAGGLIAVSVVAAISLLTPAWLDRANGQQIASGTPEHPGASALVNTSLSPTDNSVSFIPSVINARRDIPEMYLNKCHILQPSTAVVPCVFDYGASKTVYLVGDSHAAMWLPALQEIAKVRGWTVISHTKSACPLIDTPTARGNDPYLECAEWNKKIVNEIITNKPDLVVVAMIANARSASPEAKSDPAFNQKTLADGLARQWEKVTKSGAQLLAISATPIFDFDVAECVSANPASLDNCARNRVDVLRKTDAIPLAAQSAEGVTLVDMTDYICHEERCEPLVGNVLVYRDQHHLTATYAKTLAPYLADDIDVALELTN